MCMLVRGFHFDLCSLTTTQLFVPASLSLMLLRICEMETSIVIVSAYESYSDQAKVYEDFYTLTIKL